MKVIIILTVALFFTVAANAQQQPTKNKPKSNTATPQKSKTTKPEDKSHQGNYPSHRDTMRTDSSYNNRNPYNTNSPENPNNRNVPNNTTPNNSNPNHSNPPNNTGNPNNNTGTTPKD